MKISVVTVTLNSAKTVAGTLESFAGQKHPDKELVVIDGMSRDGTLEIVRSFALDNVTVVSEPDLGIYDAMNKGLRKFSGEAVGFLNSDDRFKGDDALSAIAAALETADIVFGNLDFVARADTRRVVRSWRGSPFRSGAFASGWMPAHPTFYARRRVVDEVRGFNLRYPIGADYDFMLRAMERNTFRTAFIDRVLVEMSYGGASTRNMGAYLRGNLDAWHSRRKWLGAAFLDPALIAKPVSKLRQFLPRPAEA